MKITVLIAIIQYVQFIKGADVCGNDKVAENKLTIKINDYQTILSPAKGTAQYQRSTCVWQIKAPPGYTIYIRFRNTWSGDDCDKENFKIYDGTTSSDKLLVEFCATTTNRYFYRSIFSTGENARVVLKTGNSPNNTLMRFGVEVIPKPSQACTNDAVVKLMASSTVSNFTNPYYYFGYPQNASCGWIIEAPPGKKVQLRFTKFVMPCYGDLLQVYDGESNKTEDLFKSYCSFTNLLIESKAVFYYGQKLYVTFKSDAIPDFDGNGFVAVYSAVDEDKECSPHARRQVFFNAITSPTGNISSPGFPTSIPAGPFYCVWKIKAPKKHVVKVNLNAVNLKPLTCEAYLRISSVGVKSFELLKAQCSNLLYQTLVSEGQRMEIEYNQVWSEDATNSRQKGFTIDYSMVPLVKTGSCGENREGAIQLSGEAATFRSPNYPSSHPTNMTCRWHITVTTGQVIELLTDVSYLEKNCNNQWLRIYDGSSIASPVLTKDCSISRRHWFSTSNRIVVEFVTTGTTTSKGFFATYSARKAAPKSYACSGRGTSVELKTASGKLASQRFPLSYSNNAKCLWNIDVPYGYIINLTFTSLDIEPGTTCSKDVLGIGSSRWSLAKLCGTKKTPFSYLSKTNKMNLTFRADATGRYPGFEATFDSVKDKSFINCTQRFKDVMPMLSPSGNIFTPGYPYYYPSNITCMWIIKTSSSKRFKIKFDVLDVEPSPACKDDYVLIRDGELSSSDSMGQFCGNKKPDPLTSSESAIYLEFKTHSGTGRYSGFKLHYETTYKVWPIALIAVFSVIGVIAVMCLIGWIIYKRRGSSNSKSGMVKLSTVSNDNEC